MTSESISNLRRAQRISTVLLIFQGLLALFSLLIRLWNGSPATEMSAWYALGGVPIWIALALVFAQRKRAAMERLEVEQLRGEREASGVKGLFEGDEEELLLSRRRLAWLEKWWLPGTTVVLAAYHVVMGAVLTGQQFTIALRSDAYPSIPAAQASVTMFFIGGAAFICFLFSRYVMGMSQNPELRMLRGGAVYLFGDTLVLAAIMVVLGLCYYEVYLPEQIAARAIPIAMIVFGVESLLNFVFDFYRPRVEGAVDKPSFESRVLTLLSQPGGIAKSIAETINYQFGFEVSSTWFYKLLGRALFPLLLFSVVVMLLLSCVVIVDADEQAVVERFGRPAEALLEPGLHFKMPYPVDITHKWRVRQIHQTHVGEAGNAAENEEGKHIILWTEKHDFVPQIDLLVATPQLAGLQTPISVDDGSRRAADQGRAAPVSILQASILIQYRISQLSDFLYQYQDPEKMLVDIATREVVRYAASVDIGRVMGSDRDLMAKALSDVISRELAKRSMGIEVTYVGIQDLHPPFDGQVAESFQAVITAEKVMDTSELVATGHATKTLVEVAGDRSRAEELDQALLKLQDLQAQTGASEEEIERLKLRIDDLFFGNPEKGIVPISGEAAQIVAEARARATQLSTRVRADLEAFDRDLVAYEASPLLYKVRRRLDTMAEYLTGIRKFIIAADLAKSNIVITYDAQEASKLDIPTLKKAGENQ